MLEIFQEVENPLLSYALLCCLCVCVCVCTRTCVCVLVCKLWLLVFGDLCLSCGVIHLHLQQPRKESPQNLPWHLSRSAFGWRPSCRRWFAISFKGLLLRLMKMFFHLLRRPVFHNQSHVDTRHSYIDVHVPHPVLGGMIVMKDFTHFLLLQRMLMLFV